MRRILALAFSLTLIAVAGWTQSVLFESFDTVADFTVTGNDLTKTPPTGTVTLTQETTLKQEGTGAVKLVYNYSGNQWYEAGFEKTFATPVDLSEAVGISFKVYGDSAAQTKDDLIWILQFNTTSGIPFRYVEWGGVPGDGWNTINMSFRTDMEVFPWTTLHDAPMLSSVTGFKLLFQQRDGVSVPDTFTAYFDDMRLETEAAGTQMFVIDDFNSYADSAALNAVWSTPTTGGGTFAATLDTTDPFEGSGALQVDYSVAKGYYSFISELPLEVALNLDDIDYFKVRIKGDPTVSAQHVVVFLFLQDPNNNAIRAWMTKAVVTGEWSTCIFFTTNGGEGSTAVQPSKVFEQEVWDAGGTCNINFLTKLSLRAIENTSVDPVPAFPMTLKFDKIEYARKPIPAATGSSWNLYN